MPTLVQITLKISLLGQLWNLPIKANPRYVSCHVSAAFILYFTWIKSNIVLISNRESYGHIIIIPRHYNDVIMSAIASQITSVSIVCSTVCSRADQRTSKLSVSGLCKGNPPVTGGFPSQRASNAENVLIWWRHHEPSHKSVTNVTSHILLL